METIDVFSKELRVGDCIFDEKNLTRIKSIIDLNKRKRKIIFTNGDVVILDNQMVLSKVVKL